MPTGTDFIINYWTQQGAPLVGSGALGTSVSLSANGNTLAAGGTEAVLIFTQTEGIWDQQGAPLAAAGSAAFGNSVAFSADGNSLAIGAPDTNTNDGITWIFN